MMELPAVDVLRQNLEAAKAWWVEQGGDPADIDNAILADNQQRLIEDELKALELHRQRLETAIEAAATALVYETSPQSPEDELRDLNG